MAGKMSPAVTDTSASANTNTNRDTCPRCGGAFHCGASDSAPCACTGLRLSGDTLAALHQRYDGCLCPACLALFASAGTAPPFDLVESLTTADQASGQRQRQRAGGG